MNQLREYRDLIAIIFAIFGLLLVGAVFSDSFSEQRTYLELFFIFGALLFVFSMLVIFAILGFSSFAIYVAIIATVVLLLFGIEGLILVTFMTYFLWGLIFSIELLLVDHDVQGAIEWFRQRYTLKSFKIEYYAFYPMVFLFYILIELFPNFLHGEKSRRFSLQRLRDKIEEILQ